MDLRMVKKGSAVLGLLAVFTVAGCAGNRELAREKMSQGETAVSEARYSDAGVTAPVALKEAEEKLTQARAAFGRKDYDQAARLAEEASAAAEYARVKGSSEATKSRAEQMQKNIDRLAREVQTAPR